MLALVLKEIHVQDVLAKINIVTHLPNGDIRNIDEVLIDISNTFKKFNSEIKKDKKEIVDKYYYFNEDGVQCQIYCHERDVIENSISIKQIIMTDICQKLAGIRKSSELYLILTSMRSRNKAITSLNF